VKNKGEVIIIKQQQLLANIGAISGESAFVYLYKRRIWRAVFFPRINIPPLESRIIFSILNTLSPRRRMCAHLCIFGVVMRKRGLIYRPRISTFNAVAFSALHKNTPPDH